jgi:hypothetical protein
MFCGAHRRWRDVEHARRASVDQNREMVCAERPLGVFSRQLFLGDAAAR